MKTILAALIIALLLGSTLHAQLVFGAPTSVPSSVPTGEDATAIDLDGDRFPELVSIGATGQIVIQTNLGGGNFAESMTLTAGTNPRAIIGVDIDSNGENDLVVANEGSDDVMIFLNNGSGTFGTATTIGVGAGPRDLVAADVNGDGQVDLVTADSGNAGISVILNFGSGAFSTAIPHASTAGSSPWNLAAADFNSDGHVDVAVLNRNTSNISIMTNDGGGNFTETSSVPTGTTLGTSIEVGDMNGDGLIDVVAGSFLPPNLLFGQNTGLGFIPNISSDGVHVVGLDLIDADFDGDLDIATAEVAFSQCRIIENASGTLVGGAAIIPSGSPSTVIASDVDGDFIEDLVIPRSGTGDLGVSLNLAPINVLGSCAQSRLEDGAGGFFDMLEINGSTGGVARRVDAAIGSTVTIGAQQPPSLPFPAPFLIWAQLGTPSLATVTSMDVFDLGELCIQPSSLIPNAAGAFLFANNFGGQDPNAATPSASAPWADSFGLPPFPFTMAIQGLSLDGPTSVKVTNAVLLQVD